MRIPDIGGPEWCRLQDAIITALGGLGNQVIDAVLGFADDALEAGESAPGGVVSGLIGGGTAAAFPDIAKQLIALALPLVGQIRSLIQCWRQLVQMTPRCQPQALLGIVVLRGVLSALKRTRIGTDAGLWATIDLSLDIPQIERAVNYVCESLCPSMIPSAGEAWQAFSTGFIDEPTWRCWTLADGHDPDLWRDVYVSRGHALSPDQVMLYSRLSDAPPGDADKGLSHRGWTRDVDRRVLQELYDEPPRPESLTRWEFVGLNSPRADAILKRGDGFDDWWAGRAGFLSRAAGVTEEVASSDWRAAQGLPAPHELAQYLYRLRVSTHSVGGAVTAEMVRDLLDASSMPPAQVEWAMATIYRPLSVADAHALVRMTGDHDDTLEPALLDSGYSPDDAATLAPVVQAEAWRAYYREIEGWTLGGYVNAVRAGLILPPDARTALGRQGYSQDELSGAVQMADVQERATALRRSRMMARRAAARAALKAYEVGLIDAASAAVALIAANYSPEIAAVEISATDLELTTRLTEQSVNFVKVGFLHGELTQNQAASILANAGISGERGAQLVAAWVIEGAATRPMAQVGQIRQWVQSGLLPLATARLRLANMGWRDPDLTLMVDQWGQQLAEAAAKAAQKGVNAQQAALRAAARVKQQALRNLMRTQPVSAIGQWYKDGTMTRADVTARLSQYGYDQASIDLYLSGWDGQIAARGARRASGTSGAPLPPQRQVPVSRVRAWYLDGIVDEAWARGRLESYGYDQSVIDGYISQWNQQSSARSSRPRSPAPV